MASYFCVVLVEVVPGGNPMPPGVTLNHHLHIIAHRCRTLLQEPTANLWHSCPNWILKDAAASYIYLNMLLLASVQSALSQIRDQSTNYMKLIYNDKGIFIHYWVGSRHIELNKMHGTRGVQKLTPKKVQIFWPRPPHPIYIWIYVYVYSHTYRFMAYIITLTCRHTITEYTHDA